MYNPGEKHQSLGFLLVFLVPGTRFRVRPFHRYS
jgi:hypothetical protein